MRRQFLLAVTIAAGCGSSEPAKAPITAPQAPTAKVQAGSDVVADNKPDPKPAGPEPAQPAPPPQKQPPPKPDPVADGHDFTATGKELAIVGACVDGPIPEGFNEALVKKHCKAVIETQTDYQQKWLAKARTFFNEKVPANVPKKVVYPFSGGDLSTALTVYPDADEITTMSLEPAGDPRTLAALNATGKVKGGANPALQRALVTVEKELQFLYRVNFSNTLNMIDAMRSGALPTQLIFGMSALKVHGYEIVSLRYFTLDEAGNIKYLTDEDVAKAPDPANGMDDRRLMEKRNRVFANSEIRFRKPGGKIQVHRHIQWDLGDKELKKDGRVLKHLEQKGSVSAMTKAASYLLSWDSFSLMRNYLTSHAEWMVSDATGVAPKWGKQAGFEYETYGSFAGPHLASGNGVAQDWTNEWNQQPKRKLGFRFGYYDKLIADHLVIMRKKS